MQHQYPTADIILRSSDGKLAHSWKAFLSLSSPVFAQMLTLPLPTEAADANELYDGLPVIDLAEDGRTLDDLLALCHPPGVTGRRFKASSVRELHAVIDATVKYEMDNVRHAVLGELPNSVMAEQPMYAFALACQYELPEVAKLAAKHTLALPSLEGTYVPELERFHAGKLWKLFSYREKCIKAAISLAAEHTWIVYTGKLSPLFGCDGEEDESMESTAVRHPPSNKYRSGRVERVSVHRWWVDYMRKSERALNRRPLGDEVRDATLVDEVLTEISTSKCENCQTSDVSRAFQTLVNTFAETIERRVAEVKIDLGS